MISAKLPDVVAEGRRVINNLQRTATLFLTKTVFAILTTLIFLSSAGPPIRLSLIPLTPRICTFGRLLRSAAADSSSRFSLRKNELKGSYLRNVLSKSAPGGIVCLLAVCVYFLTLQISPGFFGYVPGNQDSYLLAKSVAQALSVITFTALSFCVLFRVSLPFDNYRTIVFVAMLLFGILFFFLDTYFTVINPIQNWKELFGITYQVTPSQMLLAGITFAVLIAVYFLLDWGSRHIALKAEKQSGGSEYPMKINPEVAKALKEGRPVVALESTIISHGMPYPKNVETALLVEKDRS
jgi:magnesium-transporting ATPase (P-type)